MLLFLITPTCHHPWMPFFLEFPKPPCPIAESSKCQGFLSLGGGAQPEASDAGGEGPAPSSLAGWGRSTAHSPESPPWGQAGATLHMLGLFPICSPPPGLFSVSPGHFLHTSLACKSLSQDLLLGKVRFDHWHSFQGPTITCWFSNLEEKCS